MKSGASQEPDNNDKHSCAKRPCAAKHDGGTVRKDAERVTDNAKEIVFLLVFFQFFGLGFVHNTINFSRLPLRLRAQNLSFWRMMSRKRIDFIAVLRKT